MTSHSGPAFDRRRLVGIRPPIVVFFAGVSLLAAAIVCANVQLRGAPDDLTPIFVERLGSFGLVPLHGEGSDFWPGNEAWVDGHPETAIREWSKLVEKEGATDASLQALLNIGDVSFARGDRKQAIAAYTKAVELPVSRRPRTSTLDKWHNEKHDACAALSDIFLDAGDLQRAIKYAELAVSPHGFSSPCGTANLSEDCAFERRIADLKSAIAKRRPIVGETPEQASLREFKRPLAIIQRAELRRLRHEH
jgi:tetratricopeptide (TPR) repeat protein